MTSKKEQFYIQRIAELQEQIAKLLKVNEMLIKKNAELADKGKTREKLGTVTYFYLDTPLFMAINRVILNDGRVKRRD